MKPLIHVVDDDASCRDSLRVLLSSMGMDVVCYASAQAFMDEPGTMRPGCVLLDLRMPGMNGLELQQAFRQWQKHIPVIFLSGHADVEASVRALHQGAVDFLTKPVNEGVLLEKIHVAVERSNRMRQEYMTQSSLQARVDLLSPRERQVLERVCDGASNKEIARDLGISYKTVELHRSNLMRKMHAESLAELVRMWIEVEPPAVAPEVPSGGTVAR